MPTHGGLISLAARERCDLLVSVKEVELWIPHVLDHGSSNTSSAMVETMRAVGERELCSCGLLFVSVGQSSTVVSLSVIEHHGLEARGRIFVAVYSRFLSTFFWARDLIK